MLAVRKTPFCNGTRHSALFVRHIAGPDSAGMSSSQTGAVSPAYLASKAHDLDLSSLIAISKRGVTSEAALSRVSILNGGWPEEALEQYTTLDSAQRSAVKVAVLHICFCLIPMDVRLGFCAWLASTTVVTM